MKEAPAQLLATIAEAMPVALVYVGADERYAYANRFYREHYGRGADLVGQRVRDVLDEARYTEIAPYIQRALAGEIVSFEGQIERAGLPPTSIASTFIPDVAPDGSVRGFSAFSEDVTVEREVQRSLSDTVGQLRAANDTLDAVVRSSPTAIMLLDADGTVRMWNAAAERIYGWRADEVLGKRLPAVAAAEEEQFREYLQRVASGQLVEAVEARRRRRDGEFDAVIWGAPVRSGGGAVQVLSVVADITARRRLEEGQRFLAEAGRLFASSLDYAETIERASRLALPRYGDWCFVSLIDERGIAQPVAIAPAHKADEPTAAALRRQPPLMSTATMTAYGGAFLGPVTVDMLRQVATSDEHLAQLAAVGARFHATAPLVVRGHVIGIFSVVTCRRDLDAHDLWVVEELARQAAAAIDNARLFAAERRARLRMSRMQEVTAALSRARTAAEVADVTCRIGASAMEAYAGVLWLRDDSGALVIAGTWGTPPGFIAQFRVLPAGDERFPATKVLQTGQPAWIETEDDYKRMTPAVYELVRQQGRVASSASLPLMLDGRIAGVITFGHPIGHVYDPDERAFYDSLARYCEQALERARLLDESRTANRAKDEFLAMLGHELRNPLAPIATAVELMRLRGDSDVERERVVIERQVRHLTTLVDDLLDVSRITAGRVQLLQARVALADVVTRALETTRPLVDERGHTLDVAVDGGLHADGDPTRLQQVLVNLITNAAKYTAPGGHIRITGAREGNEVVLRVRDDGAGIDPELLPRVFDLFRQGPQPLDRPQGGLGLGLAIVRSLVSLHGGSVAAHSDGPGRGSEFVVRLPAAAAQPVAPARAEAPAPVAPRDRPRRVLIVDDNSDGAELLAEALAMQGFATEIAHDGPAALDAARRFAPDVALLDIGLPTMDGYEVARRLRREGAPTRLVAVTGYGQSSDRQRSREAGFDEHLVKPINLPALQSLLDRLLA